MTLLDLTDPASQALLFHKSGQPAPLSTDDPAPTIDDSSKVLARMNDIVRGIRPSTGPSFRRSRGRASKARACSGKVA